VLILGDRDVMGETLVARRDMLAREVLSSLADPSGSP
jgi:hypothetical protein